MEKKFFQTRKELLYQHQELFKRNQKRLKKMMIALKKKNKQKAFRKKCR